MACKRKPIEAVIYFHSLSFCVTTQEYEQMKRDVEARHMAGCTEIGDRLLAKLLLDHSSRYHEVKAINLSDKGKQIASRAPRRKRLRCYRCRKLFPIRDMHLVLLDGTQWSCDNCWDERLRS
jgi:hypothetical protein